jgi:small-conductance mechanosensitive channel
MKTASRVALVVLAAAAVVLFLRTCGADKKLAQAEAKYEAYRAIAQADHEIKMRTIEAANAKILEQDRKISALEGDVVKADEQLLSVNESLNKLQEIEPTIKDKDALITNLRGQVSRLTEMFNLSQNIVETQREIIADWKLKCEAQVEISEAWKAQYEGEHGLRVQAEGLFKIAEQRLRVNKRWAKVATVAAGVAAGVVAFELIKK